MVAKMALPFGRLGDSARVGRRLPQRVVACGVVSLLLSQSLAKAQQAEVPEAEASPAAPLPSTEPESADKRARESFMLGRAAWDAQQYGQACELFQRSQALKSSAAALLNIGRCHELDGASSQAREAYRAALVAADEQPDEQKRKVWKAAALEALERLGPEEASPKAESALVATTPRAQVTQTGASTSTIGSEISASTSQSPERPPGFFQSDEAPWIFVGAGGVLALASVGTGIVALNARAKLDRECSPSGTDDHEICDDDLSSTKDRAHNMAIVTDVLWLSGAIVAAAGVGLWLAQPDDTAPGVALWCGAAGCEAAVTGEF